MKDTALLEDILLKAWLRHHLVPLGKLLINIQTKRKQTIRSIIAVIVIIIVKKSQTCLFKVIKNNKDFLDQSLDEIKLLRYLNLPGMLINIIYYLYDYFYFKEHLFISTELLRDNLYEFSRYNRESGDTIYFNLRRIRSVAQQCLEALDYMHSLGLIHCDLKPENVLIQSYSNCQIKVIDFGSSCYITDHLTSYIQSRSYRAPEVLLGCTYGQKIDVWSLGCILSELWTGNVLFHNHSVASFFPYYCNYWTFPEINVGRRRERTQIFYSIE